MTNDQTADSIHEAGRAALMGGAHRIEFMPEPGGRWGPSLVVRPSGELSDTFAALTRAAAAQFGPSHWSSGGPDRAHITVRALEPRERKPLPPDRIGRYSAAIRRALAVSGPITLAFDRLALSVGAVIAVGTSVGESAAVLRQRLDDELGDDGWFERRVIPDGRGPLWYCSVLHFAAPIAEPEAAIGWVEANASIAALKETFHAYELCRYEFDGEGMAPLTIVSVETN